MSLNAVPRRFLDGTLRPTIPLPDGEGVWLECEITYPPSRKGAKVDVFFDMETVTSLLKDLRESAIQARKKVLDA